jgi:hypothetical protein
MSDSFVAGFLLISSGATYIGVICSARARSKKFSKRPVPPREKSQSFAWPLPREQHVAGFEVVVHQSVVVQVAESVARSARQSPASRRRCMAGSARTTCRSGRRRIPARAPRLPSPEMKSMILTTFGWFSFLRLLCGPFCDPALVHRFPEEVRAEDLHRQQLAWSGSMRAVHRAGAALARMMSGGYW